MKDYKIKNKKILKQNNQIYKNKNLKNQNVKKKTFHKINKVFKIKKILNKMMRKIINKKIKVNILKIRISLILMKSKIAAKLKQIQKLI